MHHPDEIRAAITTNRGTRARLATELEGLQARIRTSTANEGHFERIVNIRSGLQKADDRIAEQEAELAAATERLDQIDKAAARGATESGDGAGTATRVDTSSPQNPARSEALRTIEPRSNVRPPRHGSTVPAPAAFTTAPGIATSLQRSEATSRR